MQPLNVHEIIQFAVQIEKNGLDFYLDQKTKNSRPEIKKIFSELAEDEIRHAEIFQAMSDKIHACEPAESFPEDYFLYIKSFSDRLIFNSAQNRIQAGQIRNPAEALDFACARELEAIAYYQEIQKITGPETRSAVEKIISEERGHFLKLSVILKTLR